MRHAREHIRVLQAFCIVAALTVVFAVWVGTGFGGEATSLYVDDLATVAAALAAFALCARAAVIHTERLRLFWWLLAGACAAWALGEAIWALYDLVGGSVPVPSWADAAYLAALPPIAAALLIHPALHGRAIAKTRSFLDGLVIAASLSFVGWTLIFEPVRRTTDLTSAGDLVTLAYPVGDVVIIFLVVLVMRGTTRRDRLDLWWLLAGLLTITFSDGFYSYLTTVKGYSSGHLIDTGWFVGYLAIALGAFCSRSALVTERPAQAEPAALTPAAIITPFLAMIGALCLAAIRLQLGHPVDRASLILAVVLVGLVLLRQALLLVDLLAPRYELEGSVGERLVAALGEAVIDQRVEPAPGQPGSP